jgi:hypothetical protein
MGFVLRLRSSRKVTNDEFESKTVERRESREEKNREEYHREKKEELSRRVTLVMN